MSREASTNVRAVVRVAVEHGMWGCEGLKGSVLLEEQDLQVSLRFKYSDV